MAFFSDANLEAVRCDFQHRDRCNPCWGRDCNRQGGKKPPRLRQKPKEPRTPPQREKPQEQEIRTRVVSW